MKGSGRRFVGFPPIINTVTHSVYSRETPQWPPATAHERIDARGEPNKREAFNAIGVVRAQVLLLASAACLVRGPGFIKEISMSKGMNQKKAERKKPAKSLLEKRAAKKQKRDERASHRGA